MKATLSKVLLIILLAWAPDYLAAQNFPVRVTPILTPPYTPYLTDYTDPINEKLSLQVLLNDVTVPSYQCKLRLTIEGVNITIRTNPNYQPPPLTIQGGVPTILYGSDLSAYFQTANLVFQGVNLNEFNSNGGRLPEGIYRFTFEVLDYNRNTVVSNAGFAMAWMILNDPPLINQPVNNQKVKPFNPQNLVFQWTPRHRGSPNAAFTTEYDVKLVEIWPAGRNPYDAINTLRPIFETTTSSTLLVYGPAETQLVLGREYALQVRARDTGGKDLFKNDGNSEVVRFIYGNECPKPTIGQADEISTGRARMRWQGSGLNSGYLLRYREKKEEATWFEERTTASFFNASGLKPGTSYEYEVCGVCDAFESEFTQRAELKTLTENPNKFTCGNPNAVPAPDGSPPLRLLLTNDTIYAGGFDVVVSEARAVADGFSGTGLVEVPFFAGAKVRVTFDTIKVNSGYFLTSGTVVTVWDPNSRSMYVSEKPELEEGAKEEEKPDSTVVAPAEPILFEGTIDTVFIAADGNIVVVDAAGSENTYSIPLDEIGNPKEVVITDEQGEKWEVDGEGNVTKHRGAESAESNNLLLAQKELIIEILEHFKKEINLWLENNGKGPLDDALLMRLLALPDCLPQDEEKLEAVLARIEEYLEDPEALLDLIKEDDANKTRIEELTAKLTGNQPPYAAGLSETEWGELLEMICPYLVEEEDRPELVTIEPITDDQFAAGIDNDKLGITYSIKTTEKYPLQYAKLEVYKNDGTLAYVNNETIEIGEDKSLEWDGKMNQGNDVDQYIRYDESPFTVKVLASVNEDFSDPFEANATASADEEADEWNDNADMQNWVLCEGCSEAERYEVYKELKPIYKGKFKVLKKSNPLAYFKENITFDDEENTYTFLNRPIRVHKNFYPVLKDIEGYIKGNYSTTIFDAISNKYEGKIQTFSMRYINNGSAGSSSISAHGLGLALDIEPKKNPQIIYNERPLVFYLLKKVTNINFNPGAIMPSKDETKTAHEKFLETFSNTSINDLKTAYDDIQVYNNTENRFALGELGQDIIKTEIDEIKTNVQEIKGQIEANGQASIIQTLSETVANQIFLVNHKIDELDDILTTAFNTVIFTTDTKAAINYMDNTYFEQVRTALEELGNQMQSLQNQLVRPTFNYSPANLDSFLGTDFSTAIVKAQAISNEYNTFITEVSQINPAYSNLNTFCTALRSQVNGIGFENVLLEDGFCDLEGNLLEAILTEAIQSQNTEWGGQYNSKKDWMHFGIDGYHYEDYLY